MYTPPLRIPQGQEADRAYTDEDPKTQTKITSAEPFMKCGFYS